MSFGSSILATMIGYVTLLLIGVSLSGIIVDGVIQPDSKYREDEGIFSKPKSIAVTVVFSVITIAYFYALYSFWNAGIGLSALMLMVSRVPNLIFESKTGHKGNLRTTPKKPVDIICSILGWLALPVLWYSLFFLQNRLPF
jgi:hypothetical protein